MVRHHSRGSGKGALLRGVASRLLDRNERNGKSHVSDKYHSARFSHGESETSLGPTGCMVVGLAVMKGCAKIEDRRQ